MACEDCKRARASDGKWMTFDCLKCVYCAARLIQVIGKQPITREEVAARRTAALKDSVARGLDEQRIRALAKGPLALEPVEKIKDEKKGSNK